LGQITTIAFGRGPGLPVALSDLLGLIDQLFRREAWDGLLKDSRAQKLFGAAGFATRRGRPPPAAHAKTNVQRSLGF
jgi:hypothetical protein